MLGKALEVLDGGFGLRNGRCLLARDTSGICEQMVVMVR